MEPKTVEDLAADALAGLEAAKQALLAEMDSKGLKAAAGWRISEQLRHVSEGTEWTFRPIHRVHPSPDFHVSVVIDQNGKLLRG